MRNGDKYVVNGQKVWISTAQVAEKILLLARTTPLEEVKNPTHGLSLFYTDFDRSRIAVHEIEKMGRKAVDSNELFIENFEIPLEDRLGEEGRGFEYILHGMNPERILIAAEAVGLGKLALSRAAAYAKDPQRVQPSDRQEPGDPASAGEELDGAGGGLADDVVGRLAIRSGPALRAGGQCREISRRRSRLSRLRAGGDDPWRLRLRQGISRRALPARIPDPAHRPDQPAAHSQFHRREGAGPAEVVLRCRACRILNLIPSIPGRCASIEPGISRTSGLRTLRWRPRNDDRRSDIAMSFITGVGLTSYGKHEGSSSLDLMSKAAELAISDAGLKRAEIDGILCGYSTVSPHIMLATVFAEHFGIRPAYAHAVQVGGATGLAMTMLAHHLVEAGVVRHVLVVGGENRLTGQSRDASILALAQVGHPDYEVPLGPTIPAYYGLVASRYMHEYGVTQEDLAEFAVLMRAHALTHPGAQFHDADHGRRRDGLEAGGAAAETAGLLPGVGRRRGLRRQPRTDRGDARARPRLRAGAYPPACHGSAGFERTRRRDRDRAGEGRLRRRDIRRALCRGLRQLYHHAGHAAGRPWACRARRGGGAGAVAAISAATARCRSTPMAGS